VFKFSNGAQVKDKITGFKGTITARYDYITGCRQYNVVAKASKDGTVKSMCLDEDRLVRAGKTRSIETKTSGGPQDHEQQVDNESN